MLGAAAAVAAPFFMGAYMADRFFSIEFGGDKVSVAETATSTAAADVEIRVTYDAPNNSKKALIKALDNLYARIVQDIWPPV